jgi:hypothetical protein
MSTAAAAALAAAAWKIQPLPPPLSRSGCKVIMITGERQATAVSMIVRAMMSSVKSKAGTA